MRLIIIFEVPIEALAKIPLVFEALVPRRRPCLIQF